MKSSVRALCSLLGPSASGVAVALLVLGGSGDVAAAKGGAKKPKVPVVGMVTEGVAERLRAPKKKGKKGGEGKGEVGKTFTAVCEGAVAQWKVSDLGDDGAWVGNFVGGAKPKRCMLLDAAKDSVTAAKGRPNPTAQQTAAAKAAASAALAGKGGADPGKIEITLFHDGDEMVAVAQAQKPATGKSNCLDHTSLVILAENDAGKWAPVFKPSAKGKDVCGYGFFTRGDVDGDGRDEIALRVDKVDGYAYRVLKRTKKSYDVVVK